MKSGAKLLTNSAILISKDPVIIDYYPFEQILLVGSCRYFDTLPEFLQLKNVLIFCYSLPST